MNYRVTVYGVEKDLEVTVANMNMMNSVLNDQLSKGRKSVYVCKTDRPVTHKTSTAAIAWLDVEFFQLVADNE